MGAAAATEGNYARNAPGNRAGPARCGGSEFSQAASLSVGDGAWVDYDPTLRTRHGSPGRMMMGVPSASLLAWNLRGLARVRLRYALKTRSPTGWLRTGRSRPSTTIPM